MVSTVCTRHSSKLPFALNSSARVRDSMLLAHGCSVQQARVREGEEGAPRGTRGQGVQVGVWVQRGAAGEHAQDGGALGRAGGRRDEQAAVEAPRPQQRRVHQVRPIGRRHHHHVPARLRTQHHGSPRRPTPKGPAEKAGTPCSTKGTGTQARREPAECRSMSPQPLMTLKNHSSRPSEAPHWWSVGESGTCRPSISTSSWLSTRSPTGGPPALSASPRAAARPSISSKKMMDGAAMRALQAAGSFSAARGFDLSTLDIDVNSAGNGLSGAQSGVQERYLENRATMAFSLAPTYLEKSSGPLTARKLRPDSLATARASSVLLQPGGPNSSTPRGACACA